MRLAAQSAFEKLITPDDLEIIKNLLGDDNSGVRLAAVIVIGKWGTHDDLEIIIEMLRDDNSGVRRAAVSAFEKFANKDDLEEIAKKFANNEIHNNETLNCLISLDEKLFSPKNKALSLNIYGLNIYGL